ncbi:MAG: hypothetical protein R3C69_07290 [Geminicoccaceae bacterium]
MADDPLPRPFRPGHLIIRSRLVTTADQPAHAEGGLPKDRYRLDHVERAKGGAGPAMTAGQALVARVAPTAFGNLRAFDALPAKCAAIVPR